MDLSLSTIGLSAAAGVLTSLSPCVFPLLPIIIGGSLQANRLAPVFMGLGMSLSFAALGILTATLSGSLDLEPEVFRLTGAWIMLAIAVVILSPVLRNKASALMQPVANGANTVSAKLEGGTAMGATMLGAVLGMVWTPCSGPFLASALSFAANSESPLKGGLILCVFGLGASAPLMLAAYASRKMVSSLNAWVSVNASRFQRIFGLVLGLIGISILTGQDKALEGFILSNLPESWISLSVSI